MIVICYIRRVGGIQVQTTSNFYRRSVSGIQVQTTPNVYRLSVSGIRGTDDFKYL